jgi:signal transduction histidine kinase
VREAELTATLLEQSGVGCVLCRDVVELCDRIDAGAAAAIVAEEMLNEAAAERLRALLARQPPWSDFPLVVFGTLPNGDGKRAQGIARLGNVTFLDRPVRVRSMLASVHAAVRSRQRQYQARQAIESRDAFLAMLGHELRNPLGAIAFAISLLGKRTSVEAGTKERAIIERQSRHLSRMVDDLLDVARVTHGKVALQRAKLDLVEVARGAFDASEARAREQSLSYDFASDEPTILIDGDRQRLEQVFTNLLTNAIKYTPRGGAIKLRIETEADDMVRVVVTDSGIGLPAQMRDRVFEPFTQVDGSLDRAQGGLGLGLALVRSIVQLHGGSVEAHSEGLGRGSSFVVRLRRRFDESPSAPRASEVSASVARRRVLVVDDNEDIRELFTELLRQAGHEVACADDGPKGLEAVLSLSPDIAFVDVGLPGFDGLELARRVRAAGARVYLIALTGYGQAEDKQRTAAAGFDDHLVKPALDADIERAIRRATA